MHLFVDINAVRPSTPSSEWRPVLDILVRRTQLAHREHRAHQGPHIDGRQLRKVSLNRRERRAWLSWLIRHFCGSPPLSLTSPPHSHHGIGPDRPDIFRERMRERATRIEGRKKKDFLSPLAPVVLYNLCRKEIRWLVIVPGSVLCTTLLQIRPVPRGAY